MDKFTKSYFKTVSAFARSRGLDITNRLEIINIMRKEYGDGVTMSNEKTAKKMAAWIYISSFLRKGLTQERG